RLVADPAFVEWDGCFDLLRLTIFLLRLVLLAFDAAFGQADHGMDKAGEFVRIGKETFAEGGRVGLSKHVAQVGGHSMEDSAAGLLWIAGFGYQGMGQF